MPVVETSVVSVNLQPGNKLCIVPQCTISCLPTEETTATTSSVDPIEFPALGNQNAIVRSRRPSVSSSVLDSGNTSVCRDAPSVKDFSAPAKEIASSRRWARSRSTSVCSAGSSVSRSSSTKVFDSVHQNLSTKQKTKFVVLKRNTILRAGPALNSKKLRVIYANTVVKINLSQFVWTMHSDGMERKRVPVIAPFKGWISFETSKGKLFTNYEHNGSQRSLDFAGKSEYGEVPRVLMPGKFNGAQACTQTALVCIPPQKYWYTIEAIREKHDKDFNYWGPHIDIFSPFIGSRTYNDDLMEFTDEVLRPICGQMKPFRVNLDKFGTFNKPREQASEFWVGPDRVNGFVALFKSIRESLPKTVAEKNRSFYQPHLTLGQFRDKRVMDKVVQYTKQCWWRPIPWKVDRIYVVQKYAYTNGMVVKDVLHLGDTGMTSS